MLKLTWTVPCSSFGHLSGKRREVPASCVTTTLSQKSLSTINQLGFLLSLRNRSNSKMDKFVCNAVQPGSPGGGPWNSWQVWILGAVVTLILPYSCRSKWGSFLTFIDQFVSKGETAAEFVEEAAEKVEEIADKIGERLPENGKLRDAFDRAEEVAKEIAEDAHNVHEFFEKVEGMEEEVKTFMKPILDNHAAREESKNVDNTNDHKKTA